MARLVDQCVTALLLQPGPVRARLQRAIEDRPEALSATRDDATGDITLYVNLEPVYITNVRTLRDPQGVN